VYFDIKLKGSNAFMEMFGFPKRNPVEIDCTLHPKTNRANKFMKYQVKRLKGFKKDPEKF